MATIKSQVAEYSIPKNIEERIPDCFYPALAGELYSIFGPQVFETSYGSNTGTHGWNTALRMTCKKLDMDWLMDYYNSLEWYDSDVFDGIIEMRVWDMVTLDSHSWPNSYYEALLTA